MVITWVLFASCSYLSLRLRKQLLQDRDCNTWLLENRTSEWTEPDHISHTATWHPLFGGNRGKVRYKLFHYLWKCLAGKATMTNKEAFLLPCQLMVQHCVESRSHIFAGILSRWTDVPWLLSMFWSCTFWLTSEVQPVLGSVSTSIK